jgi:hypothetical protein
MEIARRILIIITLTLGFSSLATPALAQHSSSVTYIRGVYVGESPPASPVPAAIAKSVAQSRARQLGGVAVPASGQSMLPLYRSGTIMVIAPVEFDELKRGQTVIYQNRRGDTVAHILVTKLKRAWRVTGLNNRLHDGEGVNEKNLRGIVVEAFQPVRGMSVASN